MLEAVWKGLLAEERRMLYKFKSKATGDLIMLEAAGRRVLEIIGKEAGPTGIITQAQIPQAIAALEQAIAMEEAAGAPHEDDARTEDSAAVGSGDSMSLRRRSKPMLDMLRRCLREEADIVWGV
jgi:Domain of unknown function (DUF1840)